MDRPPAANNDATSKNFPALTAFLLAQSGRIQTTSSSSTDQAETSKTNGIKELLESKSSTTTTSSSSTDWCGEGEKLVKRKVYISNIEWNVHENLLLKFLTRFGDVKRCSILRDEFTHESRGFGYAEFLKDSDCERFLAAQPYDLILNGRQLTVCPYKERTDKKKLSKRKCAQERMRRNTETRSSTSENETKATSTTTTSLSTTAQMANDLTKQLVEPESVAGHLPYNLLMNIFRDLSIRDLCMAEQVCKHWYIVARMVWKAKKSLVLNDKNIYDTYTKKSAQYGFEMRPDFNLKAFKQILDKKVGASLTRLDLSAYSSRFERQSDARDCVDLIGFNCPQLVDLDISRINSSNHTVAKMFKYCKRLRNVNMQYCSRMSDATVSRLFQYCAQLETVNLTFCHTLLGTCFEAAHANLKTIVLDQCESIKDENLLILFSRCPSLVNLSLKRNTQCSPQILIYLIHNLTKLKTLSLAGSGFDSLASYNLDDVKFDRLEQLTTLDLSMSNGDNKVVANILKNCRLLRNLDVNNCIKLTDEMFTLAPCINAQLEEINLSMNRHITDVSLDVLTQASRTLKSLKIKGCPNLTNEGISNALARLSNLSYLDTRLNTQVDNMILETALSLTFRRILLICYDTKVDVSKFVFDHEHTIKTQLEERDCMLYECGNLTFEAFTPRNKTLRSYEDEMEIWRNNGLYYIGSPLGSEDEDDDFAAGAVGGAAGLGGGGAGDYGNEEEDDFEDFINNEPTEMLNELDTGSQESEGEEYAD